MKQAFTLIETVVAIGVFALLSVVGSILLFGILRGSKKAASVAVVRAEGANIIYNMTGLLRFAQEIVSCNNTGIEFRPQFGDNIIYAFSSGLIASNSAAISSNQVNVKNFSIACLPTGIPQKIKIININFSLERKSPISVFDQAEIPFQTQVVLRNRD